MSDLSQISEDTTNKNEQQQQEEQTLLINSKIDNFIIKSFSFFLY